MQIYTFFANITGSSNNAAEIQIIRGGTIIGVQWSIYSDLDAGDELYLVELATVPIIQSTANNVDGVLSSIRDRAVGAEAAGYTTTGRALFVPLQYRIEAGKFLYLNANLTGTGSVVVNCHVQVK